MGAAGFDHVAEQALDDGGLLGGEADIERDGFTGDASLDGGEQAAGEAGGFEGGEREEGGGGFSIGAGDADGGEPTAGVALVSRGDRGHRRARVGDSNDGDSEAGELLDTVAGGDEGDGTVCDGLGCEVVAIGAFAWDADEEISRLDLSRIVVDAPNRRQRGAVDLGGEAVAPVAARGWV